MPHNKHMQPDQKARNVPNPALQVRFLDGSLVPEAD